jgi:ferredoxin-NADP reductase
LVEVAAPRGEFVLDAGTGPVLLISAGIGVTPVLSLLHELVARRSTREIWWLHGARGPQEHPLAGEAHALLACLPHAHEHVFYSAATLEECRRPDAAGRLTQNTLAALDVPADATAYICGPASFMDDMQHGLTTIGVDPSHIHTELFGAVPQPRLIRQTHRSPTSPRALPEPGRW